MKRFLSFILIAMLLIGMLVSCGKNNASNDNTEESSIDSSETNNSTDKGNAETNKNGETAKPDGTTENTAEYIYFGEYPQTLKADGVSVEATADSRGYYLGSDNCYYARVVAKPYEAGYRFSDGTTVAKADNTYYFKVEPLKWRVVSASESEAFLVCESVIDAKRFDDTSNDYFESEIRAYLNDIFASAAFNESELARVVEASLDGDGALKDKVLLLSKTQALALDADAKRMKSASDYAIANGAWISTSDGYYRNAIWLLRSPAEGSDSFVCYCDQYGEVNNGGTLLSSNFFGVSPAIKIKL